MRHIAENAGGRGRFWLSTVDRVTRAAVLTERIWSVATRDERYSLTW